VSKFPSIGVAVPHTIQVDDEIYELLLRHARPFVDRENDVLRRLLLSDAKSVPPPAPGRTGDLMPYLEAGLLAVGDELVYDQPRKGRVHRGVVNAQGCIESGGLVHRKVSPSLKTLVGHEINGWGYWTHVRTGKVLHEFRVELRRLQADGSRDN
jgi:hypothetical protein